MFKLSGDPYEGARRAYLAINPTATDQNWENWLTKSAGRANGEPQKFEAFACLCSNAITERGASLDEKSKGIICYAGGYFEALVTVLTSITTNLPTSPLVSQHKFSSERALMLSNI